MSLSFNISVSGLNEPYQYSIDNGASWQSSTAFAGLAAGTYNVRIKDTNNVVYDLGTVTLSAINKIKILSLSFTDCTAPEAQDGTITIEATDGAAPYEYSIDNGATWFASGAFTGLAAGNYQLKVKDANNNMIGGITITISIPVEIAKPYQQIIRSTIEPQTITAKIEQTNLKCKIYVGD